MGSPQGEGFGGRQVHAVGVLLGVLLAATPAPAPAAEGDSYFPPAGGPGGVAFNAECPPATYLAGFWAFVGHDVDALRPACAEVRPDGSRGELEAIDQYGGTGGERQDAICPSHAPFAKAIAVSWEGVVNVVLNSVHVICMPMWPQPDVMPAVVGVAGPIGRSASSWLDDVFDFVQEVGREVADRTHDGLLLGDFAMAFTAAGAGSAGDRLPADAEWNRGEQGMACGNGLTMSGVTGRSSNMVHALGVICRPPPAPPRTLVAAAPALRSPAVAEAARPAGSRGAVAIQQSAAPTPSSLATAPSGARLSGIAGQPIQQAAGTQRIAELAPAVLLCRGGEPYPTGRYGQVPDQPEREWHMLFIRRSKSAAGADGGGLAPGECAYLESPAEEALAYLRMSVEIGSDTLERLSSQLADAGHYLRFVLRRDEAGWYDVLEHGEWTPAASGPVSPPTPRLVATPMTPIGPLAPAGDRGIVIVGGNEAVPARDAAGNDRGIIIVGGNEAVPAQASSSAVRGNAGAAGSRTVESAASAAEDRGIIIVGGNETAPAPEAAGNDRGIIIVGGNPGVEAARAETAEGAVLPAAGGTAAGRPGSSSPVALNPQPLPPRDNPVQRRSRTELISRSGTSLATDTRREGELREAPATTPAAAVARGDRVARAVPRGETPLQTSPSGTTAPAARAAADLEIRTEDLVCQGGSSFRFENRGRDPETGSTRMRLYFGMPGKTAAGRHPAAGADGVWLDPGTCAFASREWTPGDPPGVQFEMTDESGPDSIAEYLQDESHYWRFAVYKTAYGYYQAARHESWRPAAAPDLDEWRTPVHGGPGGAPFEALCEDGSYLAGIAARIGHDVDAIAPICARLRPDGSRGAVATGAVHGGDGGDHQQIVCPRQAPFVRSLTVGWEGQRTVLVNSVTIICGPIRGPLSPKVEGYNLLLMSGPNVKYPASSGLFVTDDPGSKVAPLDCPAGFAYGGLHGRAYTMVDALGAVCRETSASLP